MQVLQLSENRNATVHEVDCRKKQKAIGLMRFYMGLLSCDGVMMLDLSYTHKNILY